MKPPRTLQLSVDVPLPLRQHLEVLNKVVGRISFGTPASTATPFGNAEEDRNMQCYKATGTSPSTPNTEFAVAHNLNYVPTGFLVVSTNVAAHIYQSTTPWTAATNSALGHIYLKSDTASVTFRIIII